ncbi:uncharacterized protein LOC106152400 [Lingula anatina]|uniref:Glycine cleavage system H protein n=1 Tax=Lingula anatina TaxID=7574 RepID=A0A1S3H7E3_LINAN|nr:uncharacterized protein LOC106152400 [Lingula anatina]|eukprot:XP_013381406.1 uncharacterized protein LOC106152400 [Lingula anatina]
MASARLVRCARSLFRTNISLFPRLSTSANHQIRWLSCTQNLTSDIPKDRLYTEEHEWVKVEGSTGLIGISDYAQAQLGDLVYVELPELDAVFTKGDVCGTLESVKAASDLYSPVSGQVIEVNKTLDESPETINQSPYDKGWLMKVELGNSEELKDLMDAEAYKAFIQEE